jgi:hypothetical protein
MHPMSDGPTGGSGGARGKAEVHYGWIAPGNQVMKDGKTRERLRGGGNILCFEIEAAVTTSMGE